jgi:hypothetical protein
MKPLLIILGSLYLLTQPSEAVGKVYQYIDEQGVSAYTDSLDKVPPAQRDRYRPVTQDFTSPSGSWQAFKLWIKFQKYSVEDFVMGMSILERLILGISLALFGLVTLYVLLFKSSIASSFPRLLFRLVLILILIATSAVSYFSLVKSLIHQENEEQIASPPALEEAHHPSQFKGRADTIMRLERNREKKIEESLDH